jgi:PhzF family phenazine biosynthesis protein
VNPRLYHVDSFTDVAFAGNPAGVCLLPPPAGRPAAGAPEEASDWSRDAAWMQHVAREMNVSETAFVVPAANGFGLRWFTPRVEVDLCGHATLASAHVLWETGALAADRAARFHTRSGVLTAVRRDGWIALDFPATPVSAVPAPPGYLAALGIEQPVGVAQAGPRHIVELPSPDAVRALTPDFRALRVLPGRGVAVTSRGDGKPYDFVSRYFAPWVGVDEDPVTGSVHCGLAVYWAARLGRREMLARQASARGGDLRVRVEGERVHLGGRAITVAVGEVII